MSTSFILRSVLLLCLANIALAWQLPLLRPLLQTKSVDLLSTKYSKAANIADNTDLSITRKKYMKSFAQLMLSFCLLPMTANARPEGVNRPDLLPATFSTIIDTANYLTKGEEKRISARIAELEKQTGFKLRIVCQAYPETPGLAVKDYWQVDDKTLVIVFDEGTGFNRKGIPSNVINLNIGTKVDETLAPMFWTRLVNKLGNQYTVKKLGGMDYVIENTVEAVAQCLTSQDCKDVPFEI